MSAVDEKIVELSKSKIMLVVLGAGVLAVGGAWMFFLDDAYIESQGPLRIPLLVHGIGLAGVTVFVFAGVLGLWKLFDRKPGLVFNSVGIVDNSSALSAGLIPWSEISGAKILEIERRKLLVILLVNPEKYIEVGNAMKRALNRKALQKQGSPIAIPSITLKANVAELLATFNEYFRKYGKTQ
jgi:hypothetical protein